MTAGTRVQVRPEFDIPAIFRVGGKASAGVIDHFISDDTVAVVIIDGCSVPYRLNELTVA